MQWAALAGCALIVGSQQLANLPSPYAKSEFWLNSPLMILIKAGVILLLMAFAFLWTKHTADRWSWVRQLGTTSLLVYWVHIELLYGRWLGSWHSGLTIAECTVTAVIVIFLMVLLSTMRTHYKQWRDYLSSLRSQPVPERVSGY